METTLYEASFITGINESTLRRHIGNGWLDAMKIGCRWIIEYQELIDYAAEKWHEGKLYMIPPEYWTSRVEAVKTRRRKRIIAKTINGHKRKRAANRKPK